MTALRDPDLRRFGFRALAVTLRGVLWASRGYKVYCSGDAAANFTLSAEYLPGQRERFTSRFRLGERLLRSGFHALVVADDGTLVGVVPRWIVRAEPGSRRLRPVFHIPRGLRPLALTSTPWGHLYFGEYFRNPRREEVHVYVSEDVGRTWNVCYTFPPGTIRHVHNIIFDPYQAGLWVLTGDLGDECRVLFTVDRFRTVETVISGGQHTRAVAAIPRSDGIILPTDSELAQNYIWLLRRDGRIDKLAQIVGSCFYACSAGRAAVVSTAVEPSRVNTGRYATLYVSSNDRDWRVLYRSRKDVWPGKLFQYGALVLPAGQNEIGYLFATGIGLASDDNMLLRWRVDDLGSEE